MDVVAVLCILFSVCYHAGVNEKDASFHYFSPCHAVSGSTHAASAGMTALLGVVLSGLLNVRTPSFCRYLVGDVDEQIEQGSIKIK